MCLLTDFACLSIIVFFFFSSRRRHTRLQGDWSSDVCFFSSRRRHTRLQGDWSSDVCSSDLFGPLPTLIRLTSVRLPKSTTETSSLFVLVTKAYLLSGLNEMPCVHVPSGSCLTSLSVAAS